MKLLLPAGSTSVIAHIFVQDSTSTVGAGKTALAFGDFTCYYVRAAGTLTQLTPQTIATLGTYAAPTANTNIRIKLLSDANAPGLYEVQFHNDHLAAGANQATFMFTATGAAPTLVEIQLLGVALAATQGAITWGQQIISANVAGEGALHIVNANGTGSGLLTSGGANGQLNQGTADYGMANSGGTTGFYNIGGTDHGQMNYGALSGQYNFGTADTGTYNIGGATGFYNEGVTDYGIMAKGATVGQYNTGADSGQSNIGTAAGSDGQFNNGITYGQVNDGTYGQYNLGLGAGSYGQYNVAEAIGQNNVASGAAGAGQRNDGGTSGMVCSGTTGYGIQAVGGTADTDPDWTSAAVLGAGSITSATFAAGAITAAAIAADAIGASELAADAAAEIAAANWSYSSRTLTQSAASVLASVSGSIINITRGDSLSAALTNIGALTGYVTLDFTVKQSKDDADTAAILRIRKNASGLADGLMRVNGAAATSTDGSITINDEPTGDITLVLAASVTDDLVPMQGLYYDIQMITATAVTTLSDGTCNILADVTMLVSWGRAWPTRQ